MREDSCRGERDTAETRSYSVGGVVIRVRADLPMTPSTFHPKFERFRVDEGVGDAISIHHHFQLPDQETVGQGTEVYRRAPWAIRRSESAWVYLGILPDDPTGEIYRAAVFNPEHTDGDIYNRDAARFQEGKLAALTGFPSDQILVGRVLADRGGCYIHSSAVILDGKGFLFVGHAGAGKSTIASLLREDAEILCDDRNIVRRWEDGFRVHGTWSHGDLAEVSPNSAPLQAILFLHQAPTIGAEPLGEKASVVRKLLGCLVRPLVTADWWEKMLTLTEDLTRDVPAYRLDFTRDGNPADVLRSI